MTQLEIAQIKEIALRCAYEASANPELPSLLNDADLIYEWLIKKQ